MSIAEALDIISKKSESGVHSSITIRDRDNSVIYSGLITDVSDEIKSSQGTIKGVTKGIRTFTNDFVYEILIG